MTDLDDSIDQVHDEIESMSNRRGRAKPDQKRRQNIPLIILAVGAAMFLTQLGNLTTWIFGVPEGTIQADIVTLLEHTDQKLQDIEATTGELPTVLPPETPSWLVGYKKTLAGYKIDTEIKGVKVELERRNGEVIIHHLE